MCPDQKFRDFSSIQTALLGMRTRRNGTIVNVSPSAAAAYPLGTPEALHFELLPLGIRTKIIEPGGVNTDFSARFFVFTDAPDLDDYRPMLDARKNSSGTPTGKIEPEEVAEVIWTAVADGTSQLRYLAGDGARTVLGQRYSAEHDEAFVAGMRSRFGLRAES